MDVADLLPPSASVLEKALLEGLASALPVPYRQILNPDETPAKFLPYLAAHEGVRLWYSDWSVERKRQIVREWASLAKIIGTRAAAERFLAYVDAEIVHKISYPVRRPVGQISAGRRTPIQFPPFAAQYLVKIALPADWGAVCAGRTAVGRAAVKTPDRTPLTRAKHALATSKGVATRYGINFAHRVPRSLDDGLDITAGYTLGEFRDRERI